MKLIVTLSMALMMLGSISCNAQVDKKNDVKSNVTEKIEVYYFHFTRRCHTCETVENESRKAVEALYPTQMKNGQITFQAINLDDESSKAAAAKAKAEGQSLLIIKGTTRIDLTDKGFMYAVSSPDKLQAEIKKAVDPLLQ